MKLTNILPAFLTLVPFVAGRVGVAADSKPPFDDGTPYCPPRPALPFQQHYIWDQFVNKYLVQKNVSEAFLDHVDSTYIQHSPYGTSNRTEAITFLTAFVANNKYTFMHFGFDNNTGWMHYRFDRAGQEPTAAVDVFRFNGTCIQEHWDVVQSWSPSYPNPLALF